MPVSAQCLILVINPGSTSTKIAIYDHSEAVWQSTIRHTAEELARYGSISEQLPFRKQLALEQLKASGIDLSSLQAVIGRGGLIKPVSSGVYRVNDLMKSHLHSGFQGQHASNLGGLIAADIAAMCPQDVQAYIADPVVVDELQPCARIAGHPLFERRSVFHALNQKAVARMYARENNIPYEQLNLVVAHLGGGISVGAHSRGNVIDVNQALDGEGPFSPERSGTLPVGQLADICFSGKYTHKDIAAMINGKGGLTALCNSNNVQQLIADAQAGNKHTELLLEAMCYQVAKETGAMSAALKGDVNCIILTGGIAHNTWVTDRITQCVQFIAPVRIYPGEDEMAALAMNVQMALSGEIEPKEYQ
ncbi:MAG: butyrate kinase [Bacteroidales bacterium]|jgi:butyrate kinase|nr:butyrate kinase [Bacteroidales bacterium]